MHTIPLLLGQFKKKYFANTVDGLENGGHVEESSQSVLVWWPPTGHTDWTFLIGCFKGSFGANPKLALGQIYDFWSPVDPG